MKKKVGLATALASDVTMLLELLRPHLHDLSTHAADTVAKMKGDVKVVRLQGAKPKEATHRDRPPGIQLSQLDVPEAENREIASQMQAMEAMRQAAREEEERSKRAKHGERNKSKNKTLTENLSIVV